MGKLILPPTKKSGSSISGQQGFTIVELVMVIVLIGILSAGARSLFSSRDSFAGFIAKDQLVSMGLLAQQIAMGMSAANNPVSLELGWDGSDWQFTLIKAEVVGAYQGFDDHVVTSEASGSSLSIDGVDLSAGDPAYVFTWDSDANLVSGTNHEVIFQGQQTHRVCFSSSGYVYESSAVCP